MADTYNILCQFLKKPIYQNISWFYIYRVIKLALSFFITAWVARYLGAEDFGIYIYAVALAELVMIFWTKGLKEVVIQELKKRPDDGLDTSAAAFQLMVFGNTLLYGFLASILFLLINDESIILITLLCGIGIWFRAFEAYELWFHAHLKVRVTVLVQLAAQVIYMVANIVLILLGAELIWFGVTYMAQLILAGIGFMLVYLFTHREFKWWGKFSKVQKKLFHSGKYLMLSGLSISASLIADRFVIEYLLNTEALGYYTAAMKMTTTWTFVASSIALTFIPVLTDSKSDIEQKKNANKMFGWITTGAILIATPSFLFAEWLVQIIFGEGYLASIPIFRVLIFSLPFLLLNEGVKTWLVTTRETKFHILFMVITTVLVIVFNIFLIPEFGIAGAAYAFLLAWITGVFFTCFIFKKTRPLGLQLARSFIFPFDFVKEIFQKFY